MILGVDLGQKTTGLAISSGQLASPYATITHKNMEQAATSLIRIIEQERIDTVVIGFVEGKIKKFFEDFATSLKQQNPSVEIVLWDETLTSRQAKDNMIKLHVPKMKRRSKEHEMAASFILQSYLDSQ